VRAAQWSVRSRRELRRDQRRGVLQTPTNPQAPYVVYQQAVCDPQEPAAAASTTCPGDTRSASGTVCRGSAGVCDPQEVCDGTNVGCPGDTRSASGTCVVEVRVVCDPQEYVDGNQRRVSRGYS